MEKKIFYSVSNKFCGLIALLTLTSCSVNLSDTKTQPAFNQNGSISLSASTAGAKSDVDYSSTATTGTWCEFPAKRVFAFSCGKGNPGAGWVQQEGNCFHSVTPQTCSCQLPENWLASATKNCVGRDMEMRDSCGYLKKLENVVACGGTGGSEGGGSKPVVSKLSCEEARFTRLLNIYRQSKGLGAVNVSRAGVAAARWHAKDMADKSYFAHNEPNGRSWGSRAAEFGFGAGAENIAAGNSDAGATFCQWKNSPPHNNNMLGYHSTIGIGNYTGGGPYGSYWNNIFGSGSDIIAEPLTNDSGCAMPKSLPGC